MLQVPTAQLAKTSVDPKLVKLKADVLKTYLYNTNTMQKNNTYIHFFEQQNRTPPIKKKLTHT